MFFLQKPRVDYKEVFAPVARIETIRLVVALASKNNWSLFHLDVKLAFLNKPFNEIVFVTYPSGFEIKGKEKKVYKLHKALYDLKQAPRSWNLKIDSFLTNYEFLRCGVEHSVYYKRGVESSKVLICLYVDDLLVIGSDHNEIEKFKSLMKSESKMTNLGKLTYFLGMEFVKIADGTVTHKRKYTSGVLKWFNMIDCNPTTTPTKFKSKLEEATDDELVDPTLYKQLIGSLRYLYNNRLDLCYVVGLVSRFMHEPMRPHLIAAKRVLRYLKGTHSLSVLFPKAKK